MGLRECDARQDCGAFHTLDFWNQLETIRIVFYILGITFFNRTNRSSFENRALNRRPAV